MVLACAVPPVLAKVAGSEPYAVPETVPYRHVAFSSVVSLSVVCVVPAVSVPAGWAPVRLAAETHRRGCVSWLRDKKADREIIRVGIPRVVGTPDVIRIAPDVRQPGHWRGMSSCPCTGEDVRKGTVRNTSRRPVPTGG